MVSELHALNDGLFFHVSVYATRSNRDGWGDTQYAEGLLRAIRALPGCDGDLFFRNQMPKLGCGPGRDVVLRIVGPHPEDPVPGVPNLLWMISPPNLAPVASLARFQGVFCASKLFANYLQQRGIAAQYLPQATETAHFHPDRRRADAADIPVVFVGAYAPRVDRRLVVQAVKSGHDVRIWGPGWRGVVPDHCLQGERLNYTELAETYAAARIVLNSHMPQMADLGFMSNRTFDALSSGARVISEVIPEFTAAALPELACVSDAAGLVAKLDEFLALPTADRQARIALHDRIKQDFGFAGRATAFVACAREVLAQQQLALPTRALLDQRMAAPTGPLRLNDPARSADTQHEGLLLAADEILHLARAYPPTAPLLAAEPAAGEGVIHALMADLREMQALIRGPVTPAAQARVDILAHSALRVVEALRETSPVLRLRIAPAERDAALARLLRDEPLWAHSPEDYQRDANKIHLALNPRRAPVATQTPVGVFLHLFYEDLAEQFAARLALIDAPVQIYVSTDTEEKAARIAAHLPQAEIRLFANRGRDIWPKLYGFGDVYHRHDIVLHLHGKKSPHSGKLNDWLAHILDCLLNTREDVNRILSLFQSIPSLGLVTPLTYRSVLSASHWGANRDIARELAARINLQAPLPDNSQLQFPVGSMFWGRTKAIQPLLDLTLTPAHFPPEAGQVDGTVAHAIERMLGVVCRATGHDILPVAAAGQTAHAKYRRQFDSNRALRTALEARAFAPP